MIDPEAVARSLDSAVENGYDLRHGWTPEEVAVDLGTYDSQFEGRDVADLLPKAWMEREPGYDPTALPFGLSGKEKSE